MSKDNTIQMLYNLGRNVTFSKDQAFALIKRKLGGQKVRLPPWQSFLSPDTPT